MTVSIVPRAIEESLTHYLPNLIAQVEKKLSNLIKIDSWSWVRILENTLAVDMSDAVENVISYFKSKWTKMAKRVSQDKIFWFGRTRSSPFMNELDLCIEILAASAETK